MKNAKGFDNIRKIFFLFTTMEIGQTSKQKQKIFVRSWETDERGDCDRNVHRRDVGGFMSKFLDDFIENYKFR